MNRTEYETRKPIAVLPLNNWGGIEILDIEHGIDDYAIVRNQLGEITEYEILYYDPYDEESDDESLHPFIRVDGSKYYIDDFIRTDY